MFIENLCNEELVFRAHGAVIRLEHGMNTIDNADLTPDEIKRHFGSFVNVYDTHATLVEYDIKVEETENEVLDKQNQNEINNEQEIDEPIDNDNNEDAINVSGTINDGVKEQEDTQPIIDDIQEMPDSNDNEPDDTASKEDESIQEDNQKEDETTDEDEEESPATEKESTEVQQPPKRNELIAQYKMLNIGGNPIKMSNVDLSKAIEEAEKKK